MSQAAGNRDEAMDEYLAGLFQRANSDADVPGPDLSMRTRQIMSRITAQERRRRLLLLPLLVVAVAAATLTLLPVLTTLSKLLTPVSIGLNPGSLALLAACSVLAVWLTMMADDPL